MPRNQQKRNSGRGENYGSTSDRSRSTRRDNANTDRNMDRDYEGSRYENERYEDSNDNFTSNYGARARRMSSSGTDRNEWRDRDQSWNRATDSVPGDEDRSQRSNPNRYSQDDEASARGQMRNPQRGYGEDYGRERDFQNRDTEYRRGQFSQRDNQYHTGGGDYYERNNEDTSSGGGYGLGRDQYSQDQYDEDYSRRQREPYSRGGRVYSQGRDRYMGGVRDDQRGDRYGFDSGNRYSESGGRYDRTQDSYYSDNRERYGRDMNRDGHRNQIDSDRNESRSFGGAYRGNEDDFGRDRGQDMMGQGRYGSRGSYGTRTSTNNYLDESDDGYKYAYGSDNEEMRQSRGERSRNERSIAPGRARYAHGGEMDEDIDEARDSKLSDMDDSSTQTRATKDKKSSAKKSAKGASSDGRSKSASAKSKTGKGSSKGSGKSVESTAPSSQLVQ